MGQADATWIDVAAVRAVANRFDTGAEAIDRGAHTQLGRLAFDGATAGQAHVARGEALRSALDRLAGELVQWARAAAEIATALRAGAERYAEADLRGAVRLG
ncbi:type VII secretion target [Mycobacterium sp.]|uniref:type VII secretion target n=1 Tax=Mycobacterium sp. TaxID=1785 RepID=UPI003D6A82A7